MTSEPRRAGAATDYELLAALAERELALVDGEQWDQLDALARVRDSLVARLPARPPTSARPALERAARVQDEVTRRIAAAREATAAELARLERGRTGVRLYTPGIPTATLIDRAG